MHPLFLCKTLNKFLKLMDNTQNIERDEMGLITPYGGVLKQLILNDADQIKNLLFDLFRLG